MNKAAKTILLVAMTLMLSSLALAQVKVSLTAVKITVENGKEAESPADKAKPGDLIEYRAEYRNAGAKVQNKVVATVPIPSGMEYVADSASPQPSLASTDGRTFAAVPLKRTVQRDGSPVEEIVPASAYRFLRWNLGKLAPGASATVKARARIAAANAK